MDNNHIEFDFVRIDYYDQKQKELSFLNEYLLEKYKYFLNSGLKGRFKPKLKIDILDNEYQNMNSLNQFIKEMQFWHKNYYDPYIGNCYKIPSRQLSEYFFIGDVKILNLDNINNEILKEINTDDISVYVKNKKIFYIVFFDSNYSSENFLLSSSANLIKDPLFLSSIKEKLKNKNIDMTDIDIKNNTMECLKTLKCLIY